MYELNNGNIIKLKTGVGMSRSAETGENVLQGSISGGLISANSLDDSMNNLFENSVHEISFANLRYQPLIYQDDVARASLDRESAQAGNDLIERCMESKLLDLHTDKSCYIIIGNKNDAK